MKTVAVATLSNGTEVSVPLLVKNRCYGVIL